MNTHSKINLLRVLAVLLLPFSVVTSAHAQKPVLEFESGHLETIRVLAVSPGDRYLASAGSDRKIILWDLAAGRQLYSLRGHSGWIFTLAFSPDGETLVSGGSDGVVKFWSVAEGREQGELSLRRGDTYVAFSPSGDTLAIACANKLIGLWDVRARRMKRELPGHEFPVTKVHFVDEKRLLSSDVSGVVKLWDLTAMRSEVVARCSEPFLTFTYGHGLLAVATRVSITLSELATKKPRGTIPMEEALGQNASTFISKNEFAYLTSGRLNIWGVEAGKEVRHFETPDGTSGEGSDALALYQNNGRIAFSDDDEINLVDLTTKEIKQLKGGFRNVSSVKLSADGKVLLALLGRGLGMWGEMFGRDKDEEYSMIAGLVGKDNIFIPSSKTTVHLTRDDEDKSEPRIALIELSGSRHYLEGHTKPVTSISVNPAGTLLASGSEDGTVRIWDVKKRVTVKTLSENATLVAYSPDGNLLATASAGSVKLWDVKTWTHSVLPGAKDFGHLLFSPDGGTLAALDEHGTRTLTLWDVLTRRHLRSVVVDPERDWRALFTSPGVGFLHRLLNNYLTASGPMAFSRDGTLFACESRDFLTGIYDVRVWKVRTGEELPKLAGHSASVPSLDFSPNGKVLVTGSWDKTIKFWNPYDGKELATLAPLGQENWVIFTPDGHFDTNINLEEVERMHWVMPGDALSPLPLDIFMRDYFEPKLLERILVGVALKPLRDISTLNRTQPEVIIKEVIPDGVATARVTVEVANAVSRKQFDAWGRALESGVYDVRLFRDGQLVGGSTVEGALETYNKATGEINQAAEQGGAELRFWQQTHRVRLDGEGRATIVFNRVRLPRDGKTKEVDFSAYAFNNDRVKSSTARKTYALPPAVGGPHKGRAYVITVGVNLYENPDFNLSYATNDARLMQEALTSRLKATGNYEEVVPVSLISDATRADATKANFRSVLRALSGRGTREELRGIPNADMLKAATPDDLVLILYSGHGFTGPKGLFYLIPYDTGEGRGEGVTARLQQHSISSDELGLWLREVDAGHMALIVDACHSAAAVESEEFKPGPLGSRGLGQLAYDKGMLILTATQADNVAHEGNRIRQGLLSYVLVREGLEEMKADSEPADGALTLREWLRYSITGVPRLFDEIIAGKKVRDVTRDDAPRARANPQQPSLFDFARRRGDVTLAKGTARR